MSGRHWAASLANPSLPGTLALEAGRQTPTFSSSHSQIHTHERAQTCVKARTFVQILIPEADQPRCPPGPG
eukprot:1158534-Pelagomonas_calceolata.AAC.4